VPEEELDLSQRTPTLVKPSQYPPPPTILSTPLRSQASNSQDPIARQLFLEREPGAVYRPSNLILPKTDKFLGGAKDGEATIWIEKIENLFNLHGIHDDRQRILSTVANFDGDTWRWINNFNYSQIDSWTEFRELFLGRFETVNLRFKYSMNFYQLTQTGSLEEYYSAFVRYEQYAQPPLVEEQRKTKFVAGLRDQLRLAVTERVLLSGHNYSFNNLVSMTMQIAETQKLDYRPPRMGVVSPSPKSSKSPRTGRERERDTTQGHCYNCGLTGHWSPNCPNEYRESGVVRPEGFRRNKPTRSAYVPRHVSSVCSFPPGLQPNSPVKEFVVGEFCVLPVTPPAMDGSMGESHVCWRVRRQRTSQTFRYLPSLIGK